jgi:integrase
MSSNKTTKTPERIDRVRLVQRGKRGTYYAEFSQGGQHRRRTLKTTNRRIAAARAREINAALTTGSFKPTTQRVTIRDAVAEYLTHVTCHGRDWCERRNVRSLASLTVQNFEAYLMELRQRLDPSTVHDMATLIKQFCKWAVARRYLSEHPLRMCRLTKPRRKYRLVPTLADVWRILDAATPLLKTQLAVLAMTGMRSGELRRLRIEDVDLENGWIDIVSRPGLETKNRSSRRVPLHPQLRQVLHQHRMPSTGYVFACEPNQRRPAGGPWIDTHTLNVRFKKICQELGLATGRVRGGLTIHSLRRFLETHAVNQGVPQRCIDAWLGHTADRSMGAVYYTLTDEQSRDFMNRLPMERPAAANHA